MKKKVEVDIHEENYARTLSPHNGSDFANISSDSG